MGHTSYWDFEPTNAIHADSSGAYTSDKFLYLSTIGKIYLICDAIDVSKVNGLRQPSLFSFILDKRSRFKLFWQAQKKHF